MFEALIKANLEACVTNLGYVAGTHHFVDLWARDSLFACYGSLKSPNTLNTINTFLGYQRKDGLIPYRVRRSSLNPLKYFGRPSLLKQPSADFRSFQSGGLVYDGGLLTVILSYEYFKASGDLKFLKKNYLKLKMSIDYYLKRFHGCLISEWFLCEWADEVLKSGKILYTNVLYVKALESFANIAKQLKQDEYLSCKKTAQRVKDIFMKTFWNGEYLIDWVDYKRHANLASHPNLLAIWFEIVTPEQAVKIKSSIEKKCKKPLGVLSNALKHPWYRIPAHQYLLGLADYHNGLYWLQPWILYINSCFKLGFKKEGAIELAKLTEIVNRDGGVYEIYGYDLKPLKRLFYKSEGPFAWSSGLLLATLNQHTKG